MGGFVWVFFNALFLKYLVSDLYIELLTILVCHKSITTLLHLSCGLSPHKFGMLKILLWGEVRELLGKPRMFC